MKITEQRRSGVALGSILTVLTLVGALGCERTVLLQAELQAKQADWSARIATLRGWQAKNADRLSGVRVQPTDDRLRAAERVRVQAAVEGSRQALFDIELKTKEEAAAIAAAIDRGAGEGEEAMRQASDRMSGYLGGEEEEMRQAEQGLARLAVR